jgi:hypothetical protein
MRTEVARKISEEMRETMGRLEDVIALAAEQCTSTEYAAVKKGIGRVMGAIVLDVMNPLYAANPEVKPSDYED